MTGENRTDRGEELDVDLIREMNERYGEEEENGDPEEEYMPGRLWKITSLLVAAIFLLFVVGNYLQVFTWSPFDFLKDSGRLKQNPLVQQLEPAVVEINARGGSGAGTLNTGTGFNVSPEGVIITNRHVVQGAVTLDVNFPEQAGCVVTGWQASEDADLAVVKLGGEKGLPMLTLANQPLHVPGEKVTIIGNPRGFESVVMEGEFEGYAGVKGVSGSVMLIDAPIQPGSSGSPVLNTDGKVVGVVFAVGKESSSGKTVGLAISLSEVEKLLVEEGISPAGD